MQRPGERNIDAAFIITFDSESLPESIQVCPFVCVSCFLVVRSQIFMKFDTSTYFGPRTNAVEAGSDRSAISITSRIKL